LRSGLCLSRWLKVASQVRTRFLMPFLVCFLSSVVNLNVVDIAFRDSHGLWAQHASGTFSQLDMRESIRPLDAIPRVAATWGSVAFVADRRKALEAPYDDM
jgi:hypothetical protein